MKLLLDEMMPLAIATELRRRGHEVEGVAERTSLRGASDRLVWSTALNENLVVVTEDTDYRALVIEAARAGRTHAGIVFTPVRSFPRGDGRTVGRLVTALDELLRSGIDLTDREYWLR